MADRWWGRRARRATLGGLLFGLGCAPPKPTADLVRVTIPPRATFTAVTDSLAAHDLIHWRLWFTTLARLRGADRMVKAGIYDLPAGAGAWYILNALKAGRVAMARFTAPEGLTLLELSGLVEIRLGISADTVLALATDPPFVARFGLGTTSLEGYLLPETYNLPLPVTARSLIETMLAEFDQRWNPLWNRRLDSIGMSRHALVTLASIVEAEARHDDERAVIAGVYTNRLRLGMLLQADPTVQYAIQLARGVRKQRLYFKDLAIESPYNTYIHPGLPPGPVNSPGIKSIEASLYPATVPYLYFVAGPDGHHVFSRTLSEHNRAIGRIRREVRRTR